MTTSEERTRLLEQLEVIRDTESSPNSVEAALRILVAAFSDDSDQDKVVAHSLISAGAIDGLVNVLKRLNPHSDVHHKDCGALLDAVILLCSLCSHGGHVLIAKEIVDEGGFNRILELIPPLLSDELMQATFVSFLSGLAEDMDSKESLSGIFEVIALVLEHHKGCVLIYTLACRAIWNSFGLGYRGCSDDSARRIVKSVFWGIRYHVDDEEAQYVGRSLLPFFVKKAERGNDGVAAAATKGGERSEQTANGNQFLTKICDTKSDNMRDTWARRRAAAVPDPDIGSGWTKTEVKRSNRSTKTADTYWWSPSGKRFRSKAEVERFLSAMRDEQSEASGNANADADDTDDTSDTSNGRQGHMIEQVDERRNDAVYV